MCTGDACAASALRFTTDRVITREDLVLPGLAWPGIAAAVARASGAAASPAAPVHMAVRLAVATIAAAPALFFLALRCSPSCATPAAQLPLGLSIQVTPGPSLPALPSAPPLPEPPSAPVPPPLIARHRPLPLPHKPKRQPHAGAPACAACPLGPPGCWTAGRSRRWAARPRGPRRWPCCASATALSWTTGCSRVGGTGHAPAAGGVVAGSRRWGTGGALQDRWGGWGGPMGSWGRRRAA